MKYYLIAGEASGDLHASHLMQALKQQDPQAQFRFFGGDLMTAVGGTRVKHYRELAYMGFVPVLLHLRTILRNMNYYISPKIWAWKEYRIKNIKRDVDELFSILPFEIEFFEQKHHYPIHYVGNPTAQEVREFLLNQKSAPVIKKPVIALLAGSRKQEIKDNLPAMIQATAHLTDRYDLVLAGAPSIEPDYYAQFLEGSAVRLVMNETYSLLAQATAALVTSGTATLETCMFRVPQVVCYETPLPQLIGFLKRHILKVKYVSLVNLIANREVVRELVAETFSVDNIRRELEAILPNGAKRQQMLSDYEEVHRLLGDSKAADEAARQMINLLKH